MKLANHFDSEGAYWELKKKYNLHFVDVLIRNDFKVYLFGGALRDMVMGKEWKDADVRAWIPLSAGERDDKTESIFKEINIEIKAKITFNESFTIYRFLPEGSSADGVIDFTVVSEQWSAPPDFTVNSLYFDLGERKLIDRYNAVEDIQKKVIRTLKNPEEQFKNEPQMIFRAIKCACQFGFSIEDSTFQAMKNLSGLTVNILKLVVDNTFPGMTEWFIGNIFRGLKYDPVLFEKLWIETGIMNVFITFCKERIGYAIKPETTAPSIFSKDKKYAYEEALSLFISRIAQVINSDNPAEVFEKIVTIFRLKEQSVYGDFIINTSKIDFIHT